MMRKIGVLATLAVLMLLGSAGPAAAQCDVADAVIPVDATPLLGAVYSSGVDNVSLGPWSPPAIPPATVVWATSNTITLTYDPTASPPTLTTVIVPGIAAPTVVVYAFGAPVVGTLDFMQLNIDATGGGAVNLDVLTLGSCTTPFSFGSSSGPPAVFDKLVTGEVFTNGFTLTGTLALASATDQFSLQVAVGSLAPVNQPPVCSAATPSVAKLWPPNHKFRNVGIQGVTDPEGDVVTIIIDGVFQDEPVNDTGDGNTFPDAQGVGTSTAQLRAERQGSGNGRVYHIAFTADDGNGGTCTGEVTVGVPKSKGKKWKNPVDSGPPYYDSITGVLIP